MSLFLNSEPETIDPMSPEQQHSESSMTLQPAEALAMEENTPMRKKVLLLINERAVAGSAKGKLFEIVSALALAHCEVTVYPILPSAGITSESIFADVIREQRTYDLIACSGGDGTLNHVMHCMIAWNLALPVLYFPAGTTNDFARTLNIPTEVKEITSLLTSGDLFHYDIGCFNDKHFNYIAAFGAFTSVSWSTDQGFKNALGYGAYFLEGIRSAGDALRSRCPMKITCDGTTIEGDFLFGAVSNSTSVAGFRTQALEQAALNDGVFEVILIKAPNDLSGIAELLNIMRLAISDSSSDALQGNDAFQILHAREIHVEADQPISWTLDGEYGGEPKNVDIRVLPQRGCIYVPGPLV